MVHNDIKITNNIKTNHSLRHYNSAFIDRAPYKYKDTPIFSSYAQS